MHLRFPGEEGVWSMAEPQRGCDKKQAPEQCLSKDWLFTGTMVGKQVNKQKTSRTKQKGARMKVTRSNQAG